MNLKIFFLTSLISALGVCQVYALPTEEVFRAMQDEMSRTKTLKTKGEPNIHFVTFYIQDKTINYFSSFMGGKAQETELVYPNFAVTVRVGTQKEDNSFFDYDPFSDISDQRGGLSYDAIRAGLWSKSDEAYSDALTVYSRKQGYKKNKTLVEIYDDFSPTPVTQNIEQVNTIKIDKKYWADIAEETSKEGKNYDLDKFSTDIGIAQKPSYFLSSEGSKYTENYLIIEIKFTAEVRLNNGLKIENEQTLNYASFDNVPSKEELKNKAKNFAQVLVEIAQKGQKAEPYIGPIMLEGPASSNLFNYFAQNISNTHIVLDTDDNRGNLVKKKGLKVLPINFDVIDDPLQTHFNSIKLAGSYKIDKEGVSSQKLQLVKNGILIDLPTTRSLIKGQKVSNGHARLWSDRQSYFKAGIGNLFFFPHTTIPKTDFKQQFMSFCKEEGLEYCYIIKSIPSHNDLVAYKVNATNGEETPVYGFTNMQFNARTLRDIKFAADDLTVYNYPYTYENTPYTVIAPSVILSEGELSPSTTEPDALPIVKRP